MAITAPSNLVATAHSANEITLAWTNNDIYHIIQVWRNDAGAGYVKIDEIPGFKTTYQDDSLTANTEYCYKLKGEWIEPPGESADSNEDCETTYTDLYVPSTLVATALSDTEIELTFLDNSIDHDGTKIERQLLPAGGFAQIDTVAPNVEYYKDTGLVKGSSYEYKVRAYDGAANSAYSNTDDDTTISEPSAPSSLAASEVQDRSLRLTWTGVSNETGYKIEKSTTGAWGGEEVEIGKIRADISEYLVEDLEPSTTYYFRVMAYNVAGDGSASNVVTQATLAAYSESEYQKFIKKTVVDSCFLLELSELRCDLNLHFCFVLTSGNTYEITIQERGVDIDAVYEEGTAYTERTSIATVEANASSFWFDYYSRKLYVHASGSDDPAKYFLTGEFKIYFSNKEDIEFSNNFYYPLLKEENIPNISQEIKPYYEGNFSISAGTIKIINGKIDEENVEHLFDKLYSKYIWRNSKAVLKHGEYSFSYSDYKVVFTGMIDKADCDDDLLTIFLRDFRDDARLAFPFNLYNFTDYPLLDEEKENFPIVKQFGYKVDQLAIWIDFTRQKCKFHDGRIHSVPSVKINGTEKTEDTDYYVDYQRAIITFDRDGITIATDDIVEISYFGIVDSALELINTGANIFLELMLTYWNKSLSDLNLDSIYKAKYFNTAECSVHLYQEGTNFEEIIKNIEHTIRCASFQDEDGKIGLLIDEKEPPSSIRTIEDYQIFRLKQFKGRDSLFKTVNVHYRENTQTNLWEMVTDNADKIDWKYGTKRVLDIYTYFENNYDAEILRDEIIELLDKDFIDLQSDRILYGLRAGDLVHLNKDRFRNASGEAIDLIMKILKINKMIPQRKSYITGQVVDFQDEFDNTALHQFWTKDKDDSDRTIVEASDVLTIAIANNAHGDWQHQPAGVILNDAPKAIMKILGTPAEFITKLNSYTPADDTHAGIFISSDPQGKAENGAYLFGRFRDDGEGENGLSAVRTTSGDTTYVAVTTLPIWLKVKVTGKKNSYVHFLYSTDGIDYILLHTTSTAWFATGTYYVGLFAKNWTATWSNISAPFESFKMIRY